MPSHHLVQWRSTPGRNGNTVIKCGVEKRLKKALFDPRSRVPHATALALAFARQKALYLVQSIRSDLKEDGLDGLLEQRDKGDPGTSDRMRPVYITTPDATLTFIPGKAYPSNEEIWMSIDPSLYTLQQFPEVSPPQDLHKQVHLNFDPILGTRWVHPGADPTYCLLPMIQNKDNEPPTRRPNPRVVVSIKREECS